VHRNRVTFLANDVRFRLEDISSMNGIKLLTEDFELNPQKAEGRTCHNCSLFCGRLNCVEVEDIAVCEAIVGTLVSGRANGGNAVLLETTVSF